MLKSGIYVAENNDNIYDAYKIKMRVKETPKSFTFELVEFFSHYSASHIKMLFHDRKKFQLKKGEGAHGIRCWDDASFTFYPFQSGTSYVFQLVTDNAVTGTKEVSDDLTKKAFERFKLQWMLDHGYTLTNFVECMEVMLHEDEQDGLHTKLSELFERWEFGVGFASGDVWPCYDEYLMHEAQDSGEQYLLISVCERNISTEVFCSFGKARNLMLDKLKTEFLKSGDLSEWNKYKDLPRFEEDDFGLSETSAWSNLDDDNNCDWLIIPIGHK